MKTYLVGGAVRDLLMGEIPKDKDYVIVGSSPEEMLSLGFKQVGSDFPVFLHPITGEEYALARTERKVGVGYNGFECSWKGVSLEQDLYRRDLTINAMAIDEHGHLIDPYNGKQDIKDRILRPVSDTFKEDPLRVLRVARFITRFEKYSHSWTESKELLKLIKEVAESGALSQLNPERVWLEITKVLQEDEPDIFFDCMRITVKGGSPLFPFWEDMRNTRENNPYHPEDNVAIHTGMVMEYASKTWNDPEITFACLLHDIGKPLCYKERGNGHGHEDEGLPFVDNFCNTWKVPNSYRKLALMVCKYHQKVHSCMGRGVNKAMRPKSIMKLFEDTGALRTGGYIPFKKMLKACEADAKGRGVNGTDVYEESVEYFLNKPYPQAKYLEECLEAVLNLDTKEISQKLLTENKSGTIIGSTIREARIAAIRKVVNSYK